LAHRFFATVCLVGLSLLLSCAESNSKAKPSRLSGQLNVLVRPPDRTVEPISVEKPEALPVRSGGAMCLDAHLDEPAYVYLIWIDSTGQIVPLYPWNNERLEITDIDERPPERRPAKLIFSPLLGKVWTFGNAPGSETVLLLARKQPLPSDVHLGNLLKSLASAPQLGLGNVAIAKFPAGAAATSAEASAPAMPDSVALSNFIQPLTRHFDLVHAVQFAHAAEGGKNAASEDR
jgi:hypothetical protein